MAASLATLPMVSLVVPVFNGELFLRESLDSLVAQTYPQTEILVMDDASTDATPEIIASYGDRVRHHRQERNKGIYANCNDGIALATGAYIAVYHADDIYLSTIVEREVEFLERYPAVGAVFCKDIFIDEAGREYGRLTLPLEVGQKVSAGGPLDYATILNALLIYKNRFLRCPSSMVRASVYRELGGYRQERFRNTSDLEMWLRIARAYPIGILDEHLFRYRHHGQSSGRRYQNLRTDPERYFMIMDLYLEEGGRSLVTSAALAAYEAHRAEDWLMIGVRHYILGEGAESRAALSNVKLGRLLGSSRIQRWRLSVLFLMMLALARLPRIKALADGIHKHWYPEEHHA